jgi:HAD superfamily hydrolase (TIGR01549 family)
MVKAIFEEIDLSGVKGVLMDLDDTLYPYTPNHLRSLNKCLWKCQEVYSITNKKFDEYFKSSRKEIHHELHGQAASHSRLLYFQRFSEMLFGFTNPGFALEMEELYWSEFLSGMSFYPEAEEFLKKLKPNGIKSCVVTDLTAQIQCKKWQQLDLGRYCDFMLSSEEAGIEKPSPVIFGKALSKLNLKAEEVIMIGDNEEKDILGAEAMGIKSYLIK